jgi:hypothetical protein
LRAVGASYFQTACAINPRSPCRVLMRRHCSHGPAAAGSRVNVAAFAEILPELFAQEEEVRDGGVPSPAREARALP